MTSQFAHALVVVGGVVAVSTVVALCHRRARRPRARVTYANPPLPGCTLGHHDYRRWQ